MQVGVMDHGRPKFEPIFVLKLEIATKKLPNRHDEFQSLPKKNASKLKTFL